MRDDLHNPKFYIYFTLFFFPLAVAIAYGMDWVFSQIGIEKLLTVVIGIPSAVGILLLIFLFFDKEAWKWWIFQALKISTMPNLNGRWEGKINSSHNGTKKGATIEIFQTFSKIHIDLYTDMSESHSVIAGFVCHENRQVALHYLYQNTPRSIVALATMTFQQGSAILRIAERGKRKTLEGWYYNNGRERSTWGEMEFQFKQKNCLRRF